MEKQIIATVESRRFWVAVLGLVAAIAQAVGHPIPGNVFDCLEAFLGLLFVGDSYVAGQHVGNVSSNPVEDTNKKPAA